jgi:hypothetical protein
MKNIIYFVLTLLLAASSGLADTGAVLLRLVALDPIAHIGAKVVVQVTVSNESDHEITYRETAPDCDYSVRVLTDSGISAPETEHKKSLACDWPRTTGRNILIVLNPGESRDQTLELTHLYDMSSPGEYTVQIERTIDAGRIRSNTVNVKITL